MSYYKRQTPNQKIGIISNPCEGLNEYVSPISIRDNQLSDAMDVYQYQNDAVIFSRADDAASAFTAINGFAWEMVADIDSSGNEYAFAIARRKWAGTYSQSTTTVTVTSVAHGLVTGDYIYSDMTSGTGVDGTYQLTAHGADTFTYTAGTSLTTSGNITFYTGYIEKLALATSTPTQYNITSLGYPALDPDIQIYSSCLFATEANNYVIFCVGNVKKLFYYDGSAVGSVVVPFYPRKLISHANRVFAIDDKNKIWWSNAGDFKDAADWYGSGTTESSVIEDSGYWTVEKERQLMDMGLIGNVLYLFGRQNIYAFSGYDYDTFALQVAIPDFGIDSAYNKRHMTQTGSAIYFMMLNADGYMDVYEFNGSSIPTLISNSLISNNAIQNGVLGSVYVHSTSHQHMTSDENHVYIYDWSIGDPFGTGDTSISGNPVLVYDIKRRTWWKRSGFTDTHTSIETKFCVEYFPSYNRNKIYSVVNNLTTTVKNWLFFEYIGYNNDYYPYLVSKAYSSLPTDKQTLTSVAIQIKAVVDADLYIRASFSTTADGDDFEAIKEYDHYIANGSIETIELLLPIRLVARASAYRVKIEISNADCYLYNIERRYRTTSRVR